MNKEIPDSTPHIERFKAILEVKNEKDSDGGASYSIELNPHERIITEYSPSNEHFSRREYLNCRIERDGKRVLTFAVGERGLEFVGVGPDTLKLTLGDSRALRLGSPLNVGYRGDDNEVYPVDDELTDFTDLAGPLTDWLEKVTEQGKVGDLPVRIFGSPEGFDRPEKSRHDRAIEIIQRAQDLALRKRNLPVLENDEILRVNATIDAVVELGIITPEESMELTQKFLVQLGPFK